MAVRTVAPEVSSQPNQLQHPSVGNRSTSTDANTRTALEGRRRARSAGRSRDGTRGRRDSDRDDDRPRHHHRLLRALARAPALGHPDHRAPARVVRKLARCGPDDVCPAPRDERAREHSRSGDDNARVGAPLAVAARRLELCRGCDAPGGRDVSGRPARRSGL